MYFNILIIIILTIPLNVWKITQKTRMDIMINQAVIFELTLNKYFLMHAEAIAE